MSGIYIPGMEIPKSCCECFAFKSNASGQLFCKAKRIAFGKDDAEWLPKRTPNWCPLVSVPDHGRLIDADALVHSYYHAPSFPNLCKAINKAPTIIPASPADKEVNE